VNESGCFSRSPLPLILPTVSSHPTELPTGLTSPVGPGLAPRPGMIRHPGSRPDHLPTRRPNRRVEKEDPTARAGPGAGPAVGSAAQRFQDFQRAQSGGPCPEGWWALPGDDPRRWFGFCRMALLAAGDDGTRGVLTLFLGGDETKGFASRCWVAAGSPLGPWRHANMANWPT
jgi:hypothetical protein